MRYYQGLLRTLSMRTMCRPFHTPVVEVFFRFLPAIFHLVVVGLVTQKAGVQVVHQFSGQLVIIYIGPVVVFLLQTEGADRIRSLARTQYCVSINRRA